MKMELTTNKNSQKQLVPSLALTADIFLSPTARESSRLELDKVVIPALVKAVTDLGYNSNEEKMKHIYSSMSQEIKKATPNIRLSEIPIAIEKGVLGDYGDYHGLSVVGVIKFIKSHLASRERVELAKEMMGSQQEVKIPTEKEVLDRDLILLQRAFAEYKTKGKFNDIGNYLYKVLDEKFHVISFSNKRRWEFVYDAIQNALAVKARQMSGKSSDRERHLNEVKTLRLFTNPLEALTEGQAKILEQVAIDGDIDTKDAEKMIKAKALFIYLDQNGHSRLKSLVLAEALRLALNQFFADLVEMGAEISDYVNESN
ncbi:hypothetical protein [Sphingobacterium multivorum]|uniref:hypothetical protein n=1 Tax=Sphingobacterium multivorum TaxID=28454 RepID=UPI0028B14242|nr:hypothetical protein [Sphingobacterium multivorum]